MGYLPEAMRNYLLRLGWSHGDEDIMSQDRMIQLFDLDGIGKSPSRFDFDKLNHINAHYLKLADDDHLVNLCADLYAKQNIELKTTQKSILKASMSELKPRAKTLLELIEEAKFLLIIPAPESFEEKAKAQLDSDGIGALKIIANAFTGIANFTAPEIESKLKELAAAHRDGKLGKIMMPYRAAITGKSTSPAMPLCSEILGKDEVLKRLELAISHFGV